MFGEQPACRADPVNHALGELSLPKIVAHRAGDAFPTRFTAPGMHGLVSDDGKVLRFGCDENQDRVAMLGFVQAELHELVRGGMTRVVDLVMAHIYANFPGRVFLRLRNGLGDPIVIQLAK